MTQVAHLRPTGVVPALTMPWGRRRVLRGNGEAACTDLGLDFVQVVSGQEEDGDGMIANFLACSLAQMALNLIGSLLYNKMEEMEEDNFVLDAFTLRKLCCKEKSLQIDFNHMNMENRAEV